MTDLQPGWSRYEVACYGLGGNRLPQAREVDLPPGQVAPNPGLPADQLAVEAVAHFRLPTPAIKTNPGAQTYVRVPTFLWIPAVQWAPVVATASDGVKTVTATARPSRVVWDMGEGGTTCAGPGRPWTRGGPQTSDCSFTYTQPSVGQPGGGTRQAYAITASVSWTVSWTCAGPCDAAAGLLNPQVTVAGGDLRVAEVQAVVRNP